MLGLALSGRTAALSGVDPDKLWDAGLFAVIAAFLFSRLGLVIEHFPSFLAHPMLLLAVPSLTVPGLLLTAVATYGWLRWKSMSVPRTLDAWAPCALLVWAFLALGHFAEGSDPGMPIHAAPAATGQTLYPVALLACGVALLLTSAAYGWLGRSRPPGETAGLTAIGAGVAQFLLSFLRQPGAEMPGGLDALEWVALGMACGGILLLCRREPALSEPPL